MRSQESFLHPLAQSQEHGGDTKRLAHLELNRATEGHQPNSRTSMCYFVLGRTGGALQKPCKMTSSMLLVYMFLTKVLETDSMRVAWGVIIFLCKKTASVPGIKNFDSSNYCVVVIINTIVNLCIWIGWTEEMSISPVSYIKWDVKYWKLALNVWSVFDSWRYRCDLVSAQKVPRASRIYNLLIYLYFCNEF